MCIYICIYIYIYYCPDVFRQAASEQNNENDGFSSTSLRSQWKIDGLHPTCCKNKGEPCLLINKLLKPSKTNDYH